jgi:hypothetical protein
LQAAAPLAARLLAQHGDPAGARPIIERALDEEWDSALALQYSEEDVAAPVLAAGDAPGDGIGQRVDDLDGILASCAKHGVEAKVLPPEPNGRFAHVSDPEGTRIELWEPKPMG